MLILKRSTRAFGLHGGVNGAFLASTIIMSISALMYNKRNTVKILALLTIPVAGLALLTSQTRAWIAAFILVLGFLFFLHKRGSFRKLLITLGILFSFIVIIVLTDAFGLVDKDFFLGAVQGATRFGVASGEYSTMDMSLLMRLNAWRKAIEVYLSHPFLGYGIGNVRIANYFTAKLGKPEDWTGFVDNQYLQIFAEAGTIAGIALILYVIHAVRTGLASYRQSLGTSLNVPAIGFLGGLMICVIGSCFWVITFDHELFALMILYIGLLIKIQKLTGGPATNELHN